MEYQLDIRRGLPYKGTVYPTYNLKTNKRNYNNVLYVYY